MGVHWVIQDDSIIDESPYLIKCKGCELNVRKTKKYSDN